MNAKQLGLFKHDLSPFQLFQQSISGQPLMIPGDDVWRNINQLMELGASNNPPDPHQGLLFVASVVEGTHGSSEPMCLLFLN
eukprot:1142564-Pelagomonas_calceolata.AAC.7